MPGSECQDTQLLWIHTHRHTHPRAHTRGHTHTNRQIDRQREMEGGRERKRERERDRKREEGTSTSTTAELLKLSRKWQKQNLGHIFAVHRHCSTLRTSIALTHTTSVNFFQEILQGGRGDGKEAWNKH